MTPTGFSFRQSHSGRNSSGTASSSGSVAPAGSHTTRLRSTSGIAALQAELLDLHPVMRNCVYHPGFNGSYSLKEILTPLVPQLTYDDLVIVDGCVASAEIALLLFVAGKIPRHEHDRVRKDLLNYCERDTWAMVKLLEKLVTLSGA